MNRKYILDLHTHTLASGHAYSTIMENAAYAKLNGLKLLGMTDHAPKMPGSCGVLHFINLHVIPNLIDGIEILKGAELNILNQSGAVDLSDEILTSLDIAIASLHPPCISTATYSDYTETFCNVIKNPGINIIGHPGDPRYPFDIHEVVSCAKANNTLLEINNSSLSPNSYRKGGEVIIKQILEECKKQGHPVILGSDAHFCTDVGNFQYILPLLDEVQMPDELIINTSVESLKNFIPNKK